MHADLDTLCTALYVSIDDLFGARRGPGRPPKLSDSELVCLAVAQVLLGFCSERRWLRFAGQRLGHLCPYLPTASAYNRRLRRAAHLVALAIGDLVAHTPSFHDQLRLVDSTPVPCAASRETVKRSQLAGYADYGYCKSHHRYFWGFRLYVLAAPMGCRSSGVWPPRSWASARWSRPCSTMNAAGCAQGCCWSVTRGSPAASSSGWWKAMARCCCGPTARTNPAATGRWVVSGSGSRACSTPSKVSLGWNSTAGGRLPACGSGSPQRLLALAAGIWRNWETDQPDRRSLVAYDH